MNKNKQNISVVASNSAITSSWGFACGPCGVTAINAEIEIVDDGDKLYLAAQWVDACHETLLFRVTKESTFAINTQEDPTPEMLDELDRILADEIDCDMAQEYPDQFAELINMVNTKLVELECADVQFGCDGNLLA